jgi:hypothetical protein
MKQNINTKLFFFTGIIIALISLLAGCDTDEPEKEDTPELITKAILTFTPVGGGSAVIASATDPDGDGVQDISVDGAINLAIDTDYTLTITLINELAAPTDPAYDISAEVEEEGDEHLFFFGWTNDVFSDPNGNGNIAASGAFRVVLKHQPDLKSATSTSSVGETDLDLEFVINVQ